MMTIRDKFPRTTCDCQRCTIGCTTMPGTLAVGDLPVLADYLGQSPEETADEHLHASDGFKAISVDPTGGVQVVTVPTLVPRLVQDEQGMRCTFFDRETGGCSVHAVSPFGCSHYDYHMPPAEADARSQALMRELRREVGQTPNGQLYQDVHDRLTEAGHTAAPLRERRARYQAGELA